MHFSAVVTLGLSQNPIYRRTLGEIFCYFSAVLFERESKKKFRKKFGKRTVASTILRARETNGNRVNTGILAEEQQKKREETAGDIDEKEPCTTTRLHSKTPFFLSPSFNFFRKEKEEIKKNGMMENRRKRGRKWGADWLLSGGPIGKGAEHPQDKKLCPK